LRAKKRLTLLRRGSQVNRTALNKLNRRHHRISHGGTAPPGAPSTFGEVFPADSATPTPPLTARQLCPT